MPFMIFLPLNKGDRVVCKPVPESDSSQVVHGVVTSVTWESTDGARFYIRWADSPLARRYTSEQLQEHRIALDEEGYVSG